MWIAGKPRNFKNNVTTIQGNFPRKVKLHFHTSTIAKRLYISRSFKMAIDQVNATAIYILCVGS